MNVLKRWKIARINAQIARMEREEAETKRHLHYLTFNALPALREQRNRLIFPHGNLY